MKKLSVMVTSILLAYGANAQVGVGLMGGINLNNQLDHYTGETVSNQLKVGAYGGLLVDLSINKSWSVQPGLIYSMKGGQQDRNFRYVGVDGIHDVNIKSKNTLHYVEMPVNIVYKISRGPGQFYVGAGAYAAVLAAAYGDVKYSNNAEVGEDVETKFRTTIKIGDKREDELQRFDFGATAILGYKMKNGLFFRTGVDFGLTDIIRNDNVAAYQASMPPTVNNLDATSKNITYHLGIGYMLH